MIDTKLKRQKHAYECITTNQHSYKLSIDNYGLIIYKNGLISALLLAKSKKFIKNKEGKRVKVDDLYDNFNDWLKTHLLIKTNTETDIIKILINASSSVLMALTEEALLLADALKEFSKAEKPE